jgi:hypothetical protein
VGNLSNYNIFFKKPVAYNLKEHNPKTLRCSSRQENFILGLASNVNQFSKFLQTVTCFSILTCPKEKEGKKQLPAIFFVRFLLPLLNVSEFSKV